MKDQTILREIDALRDKLNEYRPLTGGEVARLRDDFTVEFTHNSTAIEGNTFTLDETALVLREGVTIDGKSMKEHLEVMGHRDAVLYLQELVQKDTPLTESEILKLHSLVLLDRPEDRGSYRRVPVYITGTSVVLPQPYQVPIEIEQLLADFGGEMQELHPVERAALLHLRFESIHPFIDGNGRTGRLILNLMLMQNGYLPIDIKFQDRAKYMACFKAWDSDKDAGPMAELCAGYEKSELDKRLELLEIANDPQHGGGAKKRIDHDEPSR